MTHLKKCSRRRRNLENPHSCKLAIHNATVDLGGVTFQVCCQGVVAGILARTVKQQVYWSAIGRVRLGALVSNHLQQWLQFRESAATDFSGLLGVAESSCVSLIDDLPKL